MPSATSASVHCTISVARPQPATPSGGTPAPPKISQAFNGSFSARAPSCSSVTSSGRDSPWFSAP